MRIFRLKSDMFGRQARLVKILAALALLSVAAACGAKIKLPPNDPFYAEQTNLAAINVEAAWRAGLTGKGVTIAIIDTGCNSHADLDPDRVSGKSFVDDDEDNYTDTRGHGTFVVGMLAATRDNQLGIAGLTESKILVLKVYGDALHIGADDVADAVRYAVDYGCGVILLGMGSPNDSQNLREACDYAYSEGVILIAAAGGTAENAYYPAAYGSVIGVDALGLELTPLEGTANNTSVFVTAPGEGIVSLDYQGGVVHGGSGASYAAAQVAALAAFAKQKNPKIDAEGFKSLLMSSVNGLGTNGYNTTYGWGFIDCSAFAGALKSIK